MITGLCVFAIGLLAGRIASLWSAALVEPFTPVGIATCRKCGTQRSLTQRILFPTGRCGECRTRWPRWPSLATWLTAILFTVFAWALAQGQVQSVTEVRPSRDLLFERLPFHLCLLFFLITATLTDLLDYVIPDQITITGTLIALVAAMATGELQMIHLWVDWSGIDVAINGQYIPDWIKHHQHLHGFAWSFIGLLTGAAVIWAGRLAARGILGFHAIGFGDVTLMGMVGAYIGWQPVLCAIALSPFVGIALGASVWMLTGRTYVAFGPYLCGGTVLVLFLWQRLWETERLRLLFSHLPTIAGILGAAFAVYCLLLLGLRLFLATPTDKLKA